VFTFGGNEIPSYKSRYEEIEKIRLEYAAEQERRKEALKELEPQLPALEKAAAAAETSLKGQLDKHKDLVRFHRDALGGFEPGEQTDKEYTALHALKKHARELERIHTSDKADKYTYAMLLNTKLAVAAQEEACLASERSDIARQLQENIGYNQRLASIPGFISMQQGLKTPVLAQEEQKEYQQSAQAYLEARTQTQKMAEAFTQRYGSVAQHVKLKEARDPEYIKAVNELQAREAELLEKFSKAVLKERSFIKAQQHSVQLAASNQDLDERIKYTPPPRTVPDYDIPIGRRVISTGRPAEETGLPDYDATVKALLTLPKIKGAHVTLALFDANRDGKLNAAEKATLEASYIAIRDHAKKDAALEEVLKEMKALAQKQGISLAGDGAVAAPAPIAPAQKPGPGKPAQK
ncbi:MAG: hypothetical protein K2Q01_03200, partial [Rickettsiales bacterium]|nr:hypothetical protein [Rickettsiales bacterium]